MCQGRNQLIAHLCEEHWFVAAVQTKTEITHATRDTETVSHLLGWCCACFLCETKCMHVVSTSCPLRLFMQDQLARDPDWVLSPNSSLGALSQVPCCYLLIDLQRVCGHACCDFEAFQHGKMKTSSDVCPWCIHDDACVKRLCGGSMLSQPISYLSWKVCRVSRRCHAFGIAIRTTTRCLGHYRRMWKKKGWLR